MEGEHAGGGGPSLAAPTPPLGSCTPVHPPRSSLPWLCRSPAGPTCSSRSRPPHPLSLPLPLCPLCWPLQGLAGRPVLYRGALDCVRQVLRTQGIAGFYSASLPCYLKVAPSIGCM